MVTRRAKLRGVVAIAVRQLRHDRVRKALAVLGIALAVLSVTLLLGVSVGVTETGNELLRDSGRDIWVTGGPIDLAPGTVGGFQNPIVDAHSFAGSVESHDQVRTAVPLSFQVVYVSTDGKEFETIMGSGTPGAGGSITLEKGSGFFGGDRHYADGSYDGPMSHEVIVDPKRPSATPSRSGTRSTSAGRCRLPDGTSLRSWGSPRRSPGSSGPVP